MKTHYFPFPFFPFCFTRTFSWTFHLRPNSLSFNPNSYSPSTEPCAPNLSPAPSSSDTTNCFPLPHRSSRLKTAPSHLCDFLCYNATILSNSPFLSFTLYPLSRYISYSSLYTPHHTLALALSTETEPSTYA